MNLARWLYRGGRPNRVASVVNRCTAAVYALGIAPNYLVTLDVVGRRSGRVLSLPLVMAVVESERYLVSMLGADVDWVRNVKAAGGNVTLRHGRREEVRLEEVAADRRAPVLKAYLKRAPGARPHLPIDRDAPLSEFAPVSSRFPVFRVVPRSAGIPASGSDFCDTTILAILVWLPIRLYHGPALRVFFRLLCHVFVRGNQRRKTFLEEVLLGLL